MLKAKTQKYNGINLIYLNGAIETSTIKELDRVVNKSVQEGNYNIAMDLKNVNYINLDGWKYLLRSASRLKENNGNLYLLRVNEINHEIIDLLKLNGVFKTYNSIDDVIQQQ